MAKKGIPKGGGRRGPQSGSATKVKPGGGM